MTAVPLEFQIDSKRETIQVFGLTQPITANSLAANIGFVQWDGVTVIGNIRYNDRIALPEQFTDPSPYQNYINQWMTGAAAAATLPLTLAQAQAVKASLIDSVWSGKRQSPVTVTTSQGSFSFDANDVLSSTNGSSAMSSAMAGLATQINLTNTDISTTMTSINATFNTLGSQINTALASIATTVDGWASTLKTDLDGNWTYLNGVGNSIPNASTPTLSMSPGIAGANASATTPAALSLNFPVKMLPIGSTSYPAFTTADLFAVIAAVKTQRDAEQLVRAQKQAAVAALSTVASVIAYDATTGW